jgi:hypothetical protein
MLAVGCSSGLQLCVEQGKVLRACTELDSCLWGVEVHQELGSVQHYRRCAAQLMQLVRPCIWYDNWADVSSGVVFCAD